MGDHRPLIFYGWWVVLTAALGLFLGAASIIPFSFGIFLAPLSREFHSGRATIALASSFFNLALAVSSPVTGWLVDRHGARRVILVGTVALGAILISSNIISNVVWQLYVFYSALGLVAGGSVSVSYSKVVSHWFDMRRGIALGLMMCGTSFGTIIMPSASQRLIALYGWRAAYALIGAAVLAIPVPAVAIFLKERPEEMGLVPDGAPRVQAAISDPPVDRGPSLREAARDGTFWIVVAAFFLVGVSIHGCFIHLPAMMADRGATARAAAMASSVLGAGVLFARLVSGYLLDRFFGPHIAVFFFCALSAGIALLRISSTSEMAFVAAFLLGLGLGAEGDLLAYMTSRYFGLRSFGGVYGYSFAAFLVAGALGGYLMGAGFDWAGSYSLPLTLFFVATAAAVLLMTRLGGYRFEARREKIEPI